MKKSGLADSPFFTQPPTPAAGAPTPKRTTRLSPPKVVKSQKKNNPPVKHESVTPRHHDTRRDTTIPRDHDGIIEGVRKAVKAFGKEAATYRFTAEEKKALADIIYTYQGQRIKTNGNEITRIALNFLVRDYEANGERSILHKVIQALNA